MRPQLLTPEFFRDPYPTFRDLRAQATVVWNEELHGWLVTGLSAGRTALADHQRFSSARVSRMIEAMVPGFSFDALPLMVREALEQDFLFLDPPAHTPIRRILGSALRGAIEKVAPAVEQAAIDLVADLQGRDTADLQREFADRIPAITMGLLLGLSPKQRDMWQRCTYEAGPLFGASLQLLDPKQRDHMLELVQLLNEEMSEHLYLTNATGPLVDPLRAAVRDRQWTPEEGLGAAVQIYTAGVLTTGDVLGLGLLELMRDPSPIPAILHDDASLDRAIEELVRFTSPAQMMHRVARVDTQLDGHAIAKGDLLYVIIAAANRDPDHFQRPDDFDVTRSVTPRHLGFGSGVHRCIGAALAHLELRAALRAILPVLGRWAPCGPPPFREYTMAFRGLDRLPVEAVESSSVLVRSA